MTKAPDTKPVLTAAALTEKNDLCLSPAYLQKLRTRLKRVVKQQQAKTAARSSD